MPQATPTELLTKVAKIVCRKDWRDDPEAIEELQAYVIGDPLDPEFEFFGVPEFTTVAVRSEAIATVELVLETASLPYRATVALDTEGRWKLKEFLTQCTGCLGSGQILNTPCNSCSGTGWGLRPS
jgi:hypothetical protein